MVFSSMTFLLLFLPIVLLLYFSAGSLRRKNAVLLLASLLFYAWGEPVCVLAMLFTTAVNYFCAAAIVRTEDPRRRKAALSLGVGVSLALLFYFKYFSFALQNLAALFSLELAVPQIRLPIGISFYTFQVLTYTVDVYRGKAGAQKSFQKLLLYVSCFPQLIAGPIVQYADVAAQLDERRTSVTDFSEGIERFVVGLAKKVLLANVCGAAVEALPGGASSLAGAWYHAFLYTLQIYFDFSAYSDMAIGLGRTLGFRYKENFRFPYASLSVTEFWRRWHISMGSFFRDYVYIPLGGSRCGRARTIRNIAVDRSSTLKDDRNTDAEQLYKDAERLAQELKDGFKADEPDDDYVAVSKPAPIKKDDPKKQTYSGPSVVSYALDGRKASRLSIPAYRCLGAGHVTVIITVDPSGNVVNAKIQDDASSNDRCLRDFAIRAARLSKFSASASAPARQIGNIVYMFIAQ